MSDPLIVIDTSLIRDGRLEDVEAAVDELVAFVEANEPDIVAYEVFVDRAASKMTVLQVHSNSASMELHMQAAAPIFERFAGLLQLTGVDFYGCPSDALLEQMRTKADLLGPAPVVVNDLHAGFFRIGSPGLVGSN